MKAYVCLVSPKQTAFVQPLSIRQWASFGRCARFSGLEIAFKEFLTLPVNLIRPRLYTAAISGR